MEIHPIISVIHLEQAYKDDFYQPVPYLADAPPIIVDGQEGHEIDKIILPNRRQGCCTPEEWRHIRGTSIYSTEGYPWYVLAIPEEDERNMGTMAHQGRTPCMANWPNAPFILAPFNTTSSRIIKIMNT